MFGIKSFAAIINPPQACILAVGTTEVRVVQNTDKATAGNTTNRRKEKGEQDTTRNDDGAER